jgi:hypothetical protein
MIKQILSAGWQTVGYRQNTELFVEAWHWNPEGTWSGPGDKGYFVGNSTPIEFIRHSLGYPGAGDAGLVNAILTGPIQYLNPKTNGLQFFSASTFSNVVTAGYGTAPRNVLRGPGRTNLDLSLAKTTPLYRERITLELRVDAFNVLNHTEFNNLDNNAQDIGCAPAILVERTSAIESPAKREYDDCLNRVRHAMDTDNPSSHLPVFAAS